tara:strand:- start:1345 stop:2670 length:1326 start_codon:yes stop_codon:yes gene_type:complete
MFVRLLVLFFHFIPALALGQYCASGGLSINTSGREVVTQVMIGSNLTPYSISCIGYTDNTALSLNSYTSGSSIQFLIYTNKCAGWTGSASAKGCKIFMDWNNDGDFFDLNETVYISPTTYSWTQVFMANVVVPQNVQCTQVRTRIVYSRLGGAWPVPGAIGPCGMYNYGETEDYIIPIESCFSVDAGSDQVICENDTSTLNPQIIPGATYSWYPNIAISNTNVSNPTIYPNSTTTYILTVDSLGNVFNDSVTIYVYPNPIITVSQDQTICNGGTPSNISVSNIPGATYTWNPSTNLASPNSNQTSFTSSLINSTTYNITVGLGGCYSNDSVEIEVNPIPTVSLIASPNPACIGDDIVLLANTSIPVIRYRFQFNTSNTWQNITTQNPGGWGTLNPVIFNNITPTTQFRVRVREDWGCNTSAWSPVITVPIVNISAQPIIHN